MAHAIEPNLATLVERHARLRPDDDSLIFVSVSANGAIEDERRSYTELLTNARLLAGKLAGLGVTPGGHFAIMLANHPEFVEAMLASALLGTAFVPVDPRTVGEKLEYMLRFAECTGVICTADAAAAIRDSGARPGWLIVVGEDPVPPSAAPDQQRIGYAAALAEGRAPPGSTATPPGAPMMMMFTSGTTGNPKAVVQSYGSYMAATAGSNMLGFTGEDVFYTGLSLTHINAQGTLRSALALGARAVISRKFTKTRLWDICRRYGCTTFNLLGGMIPEMFSIPARPDDADNPVRVIVSAGMPPSLWRAYEERFGVAICEVYGATEGGGALINLPGQGPVGSIGKPVRGCEAAVLDADDQPCAAMQPGELCFRRSTGEPAKVSYFRNDAASSEKVRGGWFRTGDIVHRDEDGWYFFHHRVGGGVRRNGDFVNTALVESAISKSGLVEDVFVYGVARPGNVAGEKTLVAAVVPLDPSGFDAAELIAHCRATLQRNDVPEIVQPLARIPKTISEKPIERACIALLDGGPHAVA